MTVKSVKTVSINIMIARGLAVAIAVACCLMIYPVLKLYDDMVEARQQQIAGRAMSISRKITDALSSVFKISEQIVSTREVRDMTLLEDRQRVEAWSVATRKLFPSSVGMSILDKDAEFIGDKGALLVGKQCAVDAVLFMNGEHLSSPPVHISNHEKRHFDVLNKITDDEGNISGALQMSFHLSMMQETLNRYAEAGYRYELKNKAGIKIASHGDGKYPYLVSVNLPDTDWVMDVSADDSLSAESVRLIQFGVVALIIIALLFMLVVWFYVSRRLMSDIYRVKLLLSYRYLDAKDKPSKDSDIHLSEIAELLSEIDQLADDVSESRTQLELQACTDKLTGLLNRRGFEEDREKLYRLAYRMPLILILLDIDSFKKINDTYGHATGDYVLKVLGEKLRESVRSTDKIYRLGGDEILMVFSTDNLFYLQKWYENLSENFSDELTEMEEYRSAGPGFTLSAGATVLDCAKDKSLNEAMVRADQALYEAKESGRAKMVTI